MSLNILCKDLSLLELCSYEINDCTKSVGVYIGIFNTLALLILLEVSDIFLTIIA